MKTALSKTLLCGVLATSFILINCQKAPNRPKAGGNDVVGKPAAAKLAQCSEDMLKGIAKRSEILAKMGPLLKKAAADLSAEEKTLLTSSANELKDETDKLVTLMRAAPVDGAPADGCKELSKDPKVKDKEHKIADLLSANNKAGVAARDKTGEDNNISKGILPKLVAGKVLVLAKELADLLSDKKNYNGAAVFSEGKITTDKAAIDALGKDRSKTACLIVQADEKAVAENTKATVIAVTPEKDQSVKPRDVVKISLEIKEANGSRTLMLGCAIADNKPANDELIKAFGSLISFSKDPASDVKQEENKSEEQVEQQVNQEEVEKKN